MTTKKPAAAKPAKRSAELSLDLTDRQVAFLAPLVERQLAAQRAVAEAEAEISRAIMALAPPDAKRVNLDPSTSPWTLKVKE